MDYRVEASYDDVLRFAKQLAAEWPQNITTHAYFEQVYASGAMRPFCIVSHILARLGFDAPQEWWSAQRYDGTLFTDGKDRVRRKTHIRFLEPEIFSNEDLSRDAFLNTLQSRQDNGTTWAKAVRAAEQYVTRINKINPQR